MNLLEDLRNRGRYEEQTLEDGSIYWYAEMCTMTEIIDYLASALMKLNTPTEIWLRTESLALATKDRDPATPGGQQRRGGREKPLT